MRHPRLARPARSFVPFLLAAACAASAACGGGSQQPEARVTGQSEFASAPPPGASGPGGGGALSAGASQGGAGGAATNGSAAPSAPSNSGTSTQPRTVQETDLYRLDGNRLYYLNSYRGLMVFDVSDVDHPKLLGRSPIFGTPVQMFVQNGIAVVVVADWYGVLDSGQPFHGSIVRGLDATDPTNIQVLGDAKLGGWIQDTRIVGDVLYAVSEDFGWVYGWGGGAGVAGGGVAAAGGVAVSGSSTTNSENVIVSSVSFANGRIQQIDSRSYPGYGGVFNVTPSSIMLAHPVPAASNGLPPPAKTALQYLDISDPAGHIVERGSIEVAGSIQGWGADNGRWNLDFADGRTAHVIGCSLYSDCGSGYVLATADFSNPDQPVLDSELAIASTGWTAAARFDAGRMYLSPGGGYYYGGNGSTPLEVFDLSNPAAPRLAGTTQIPGSVWLMIPSGNQLFALGQDNTANASQVSLKYLDVSNPAAPTLIGTSNFGDGWAWTPAADTFKAFTMDANQHLVVLPFSGWSASAGQYNNGVQLIEFTPTSIATAGAAHTTGWVERGIFANGRILSLSDLALSVVDYSDPLAPTVTAQLTLARNVIAAQPSGSTIAEISSDWWGNDTSHSDVRVLPIDDAPEIFDHSQAPDVSVPGVDARVFTNGSFAYVVTAVQVMAPCPTYGVAPSGPPSLCATWQEQVEVVDLSNGGARARGTIALPVDPYGWSWYWGWGGFYWNDWYSGGEIVQVGGDALAFRRWHPNYSSTGQYIDASSDLFVVDLSNPDAPSVASTVITDDPNGWWGNMQVVGSTLYTTHYVWPSVYTPYPTVRYFLDAIDLADRKHPKVQASINVPGILVGGSQTDPSILYTIDYRWNGTSQHNDFDAIKIVGGVAYLQSTTTLDDGWVGSVFVRGDTAYTSTQQYVYNADQPAIQLHQIDLSNPTRPVDRVASGPQGWGWLVDVQGDRMLVTSGWGPFYSPPGLDIYRLSPTAAPAYDQFVRTLGWSISSAARQDSRLFLSSGYWGVQTVQLQ
ncbi:MAG TPA: beta-propeller domain-containing protein [Polyangiaceae bacterium]|nr:beta-propeller domain-containing protein [Polyangiaceae bacterium]